jgi:hypothetical protein
MKFNVSFSRFKLPVVLVVGLIISHSWSAIAVAQSALPATVPVSVNAIALTVTPNPAKAKEKITLACYGHNQQESSDRRHGYFFDGKLSLVVLRW